MTHSMKNKISLTFSMQLFFNVFLRLRQMKSLVESFIDGNPVETPLLLLEHTNITI